MREDLYGLLDLQEVDNEIDALHRHKKDYPDRIAELQQLISEISGDRKDKSDRLAELEKANRHFQHQLEVAKEDLGKHQERLSQTSNTREYDAVQQEIVSLKHSIDEYEMELLKADEETETLRQEVDAQTEEQSAKLAEHEQEIADLEQKTAAIDSDVARTRKKRESAAEGLPKRLQMAYERVRRGKGLAVVRVTRGACGGCWKSLPPQQINELRRSERINVCEGCGRVLVWDDREAAAEG